MVNTMPAVFITIQASEVTIRASTKFHLSAFYFPLHPVFTPKKTQARIL